ncbi:MAG TPA: TIR domain-containing protein, partial [Phototrophicaceae bacterium]|nr:TIR domain-containing protein [Phototrophicaceae bacterium]
LHCTLEYYQSFKCFMLTDEGSSSGTKLDGQPVAPYQPVALRDGDLIELGLGEDQGAVLRFHSNVNPPDDVELQGGRLRLHMGFDPKETIRQVVKNHQMAAIPACDVFLSYSRRDRDAMHYLRESLVVSGFTVWSDENLEPGSQSWRAVVATAIEKAGCLVMLLSPDAKQSDWVGEELNYGKIHGKRIFTLLLRGDESNAIPLGLTGVQWIDMRAGYEEALEQLLRSLRAYLGQE